MGPSKQPDLVSAGRSPASTWLAGYQTPVRSLLILSAALFVAEFSVMHVLEYIPRVTPWLHYTLDASLMLLLAFPALYFFVLQPLHRNIAFRDKVEAELRDHRFRLEQTVEERTAELKRSNLQLQDKIVDCHRTEQALRTSEAKYRNLFERMNEGFAVHEIICDQDGIPQDARILDVNPAYERLTGFPTAAVIGRTLREIFPNFDPLWIESFGRVALTGEPHHFETYSKDVRRWYEVHASRTEPGRYVVVFMDVTERREIQEALRESREDLNRAQAVAHTGSWRLDTRRGLLVWSDESYRIFGIPAGTPLTYELFLDRVHPEDREYVDREWKAALAGSDYNIEHRILADSQVKWVREKAELERDENGEIRGGFGTVQDITELKQAQAAVAESERRYRDLVELSPDAILVQRDDCCVFANPAGLALLRVSHLKELLGQSLFNFVRAEDRTAVCDWLARAQASEEQLEVHECEVCLPNGGHIHVELRAKSIQFQGFLATQLILRDVSERRKVLAERERLLRQLADERATLDLIMENTRAQLAYLDGDFNFLHVNSAYERGSGYTRAQLIGRNHFDLFPDPENEAIFRKVRDTGEPAEYIAKPYEFKDQPERGITYWDWTLVCMRGPSGQLSGFVLSLMDVTPTKRAEIALRESEERVRQALQVGRMFTFDWSCQSDVVVRSAHCAETLGLEHKDAVRDTGERFFARLHPEDRQRFLSILKRLSPTADTYRVTYRVHRPDGNVVTLEEAARGFFDADGKLARVTGITADVTQREKAQRALEWELAVNEAVSAMFGPLIAHDATIEGVAQAVSMQARYLTASPHCIVTCIDPASKDNICHTFTLMMDPGGIAADKPDMQRLVFPVGPDGNYPGLWGHALNTKQAFFTNEPSHRHPAARGLPKGHIPVERLLAVPVLLGTELLGEILVANSSREYAEREMLAVQRLAEHYALAIQRVRFKQALQAERDFVEAILATAGALVVVLDPNRRIIRLNPAFQKTMGYQSEEVVGRHFRELFILPEDRQVFDQMFTDLEGGKFPIQGENSLRAKDGSLRRVLWSNTVLLDDRQRMQFVICTGLDVTEVRAVEDKLRVLTRAMEAGPAGVVITNPDGNITYVNRACEVLTGYTLQELLDQTPRVWNSGAHPPEMFVELWNTIKKGWVWRGEICNRRKQGDLFWIHASISPVTDGAGHITHFVAVTIDITKRRQFEQALQQAQQDLERKVSERTADLNASLAALNLEIDGRRRAEFEIKQLLEFERLVTDISAHFASLKPGLFHATLHEAVYRLMGFLDADAAALVEFVGENTRLAVGCYAPGMPHPERLPVEQFPWTFGTLRAQQQVCFSSLTELPAEAQTDFASYRHASMESVLAIPLVVSDEAIGALIFNTVARQHTWPAEALPRMRIVENLFSTQLLRWRSEQALTEAETRFHAVADFVRDWEYWVSPEGSILFCSPASEHITGHRPEKFLVEPALLHNIVLPEDARIWSEHHADVFGTPQAHNLEFRIRRADGKVRWIQHFSQPVFGEQGQFLGFRVNNRDITQSKESELETQRLHAELAHMARAATVDQLAASLAHELRQPLTAIMSNAEAAVSFLNQAPADIGEAREALEDIIASDERASEVIRRLRALYRKTDLERGSLDVNKVIEDTLMLLRSELILRQVSNRLELDPALPRASGNRIELQQVLMNLILNAADAMHGIPSSDRLLILSTRSESGAVIVSLQDSGTGLKPETMENIFEPFYTTKESGMGMGLTLCRSIIKAHGGRLWAENNPGPGATFFFTLPLHQSARL